MFTTLMPASAPPRTRTRRGLRTTLLAVAALAMAVTATQMTTVALQDGAPPIDELVDRLVELERQLPALPPDEVLFSEGETWAEFTGDFTGAKVTLDSLAEEARQLFIDGNEAKPNPVATAVASDARAILLFQEGYGLLAEYESYDLAFPVDSTDDEDVATGADEPYGLAETGLRLVMDAHDRRLAAFEVLRDADVVDDTEREFFEVLFQAEVDFDTDMRPVIHRALSLPTTAVMTAVERFGSSAPGSEARARTFTVACIPREAYSSDDLTGVGLPEALVALSGPPAADCPDLTNGNDVRLIDR